MSAWRIAWLFTAFGIAWILGSDHALELIVRDAEQLSKLQSLKGLVFITLNAVLIYALTRSAEKRHQGLQRELAHQRDRLARLLEVTPAAIYTLTPDPHHPHTWNTDFVSANIEQLTGFSTACWLGESHFWRSHLHPEDRERVLELQRQLFNRGWLHHEYRILHADGQYRWMADTLQLIRNEAGEPALITGAWLDVTERRQHQERMRVIEHVLESAAEGIFVTDAQARFLSVNRAFSRITGYSADEVIGRTPAVLKSGHQDRAFYTEMWRQIAEEGRWEGEIWNRRKDGVIFPEWLTISAIRDEHRQVVQYLGVFTEISGRKQAEERIRRLANHDSLTDLPNRTLLADRARVALAAAQRQHQPVAVMHLNVDHFGGINESLGHEVGDQVLRVLAGRLADCLRPDDTLTRLGGDDFVLLLPNTSVQDVAQVTLRLMEAVAEPLRLDGGLPVQQLSASIGVALYPDNGQDLVQLSRAAETALHLAKREGRNTVRVASRELQQRVQETLRIAGDLRGAAARGELRLHYQAQMDAATHRVVGAEALVRWQHPERGLVSPGVFIPVAEETGLIQEIGLWVLREAVRQNAAWQRAGLPAVPVAINLSAAQFRHPGLLDTVARTLREHDLAPDLLELELTESVAMENSEQTIQTIAALKHLGVQLSIDDFGTGYSSLVYLKRYAVDKLKIDQSFVRGLNRHAQDEAIVATIIDLATHLGLRTIAEGVETAEQARFLSDRGCDELQGFHFHRPSDAAAFEQLLQAEIGRRLARHLGGDTIPAPLDALA